MKWTIALVCIIFLACSNATFAQTAAPDPTTFKLTIAGGTFRDAAAKKDTSTGTLPAGAKSGSPLTTPPPAKCSINGPATPRPSTPTASPRPARC